MRRSRHGAEGRGSAPDAARQDMRQLIRHFSHDLHNPLVNMQALLNDMKLMLAEAEAGRPAVLKKEMPEVINLIEQSVDRMGELINGANDIYHCMFDELECEAVDMRELTERVLNRFEGRLSNIDISLGPLPDLRADPLALARVVEQLIDNAVKSMQPAGGELALSVEIGDDSGRLVVSDSGCGISRDDLEQMFLPFYTTREGASGMGLAVVKALTEAHGGRVWCESEPGNGATFYATFPVLPGKLA
ncbi:MAG: HAMP domain-containing sensor histidine kinase [Mariprofundaceae bacterium]|nr:HAMP domain-containing sensor histidine kinase [Mariprofundaceae bacterium]